MGPALAKGFLCAVCGAHVEADAKGRLLSHWARGGPCSGGGKTVSGDRTPGSKSSPKVSRVKDGKQAAEHELQCSQCQEIETRPGPAEPGVVLSGHKARRFLRPTELDCPGAGQPPTSVIERTAFRNKALLLAVRAVVLLVGSVVLFSLFSALAGDGSDSGPTGPTGKYSDIECNALRAEALRDDNPRRLDDLAEYDVHC